jgi:GNAT superfamily N-acetyltransferase
VSEPQVAIRDARLDDREGVWPLARDFATSFVPDQATFSASYEQLLERADTLLIVAEADQRIAGYLLASDHLTFFANGPVCWVEELMVAPDVRRLGIGAALMNRAEHWAGERGSSYLSLATRRASAFYTSLAYEESALFYRKMLS